MMRARALAAVLLLPLACVANEPDPAANGQSTSPNEPGGGSSSGGGDGGGASSSSSSSSSSSGGADAEPPPVPYVHFDVNHVLSTGQSNAVANGGVPVLSTTQPYANLMFDTGVMTGTSCDGDGCRAYQKPSSLVPLVEGDTFFYPVETMSAGLANEATKLALRAGKTSHDVLVSLHGRSGNSYWCLRKGGCGWWADRNYVIPFAEGMMQVADAKAIAAAAGKSYVVRAVTAVHGEHDHYAYELNESVFPLPGTDGTSTVRDYADALVEWQRDYEAGVKAITGQSQPVPLFVSQYSHWNNVPTTKIAYMQLAAHVRAAGKVVMVGPTYALGYDEKCLHFTGHGERRLGEYFAKAYARVVIEGRRWEPLRPIDVRRAGDTIRVKYLVPKPPLVLDTTAVNDPGNFGFELADAGGVTITGVALEGADTVVIRLSGSPGTQARLRYAYTFRGCAGPASIARGNLRDSDDTPSQAGYPLPNWSVHFDEAVN